MGSLPEGGHVLAFPRFTEVRIFYAVRFRRHQGTALRCAVSSVDRGEVLLVRLMLSRFLAQKIRLFESPCAASGLGFDCVRGETQLKRNASVIVEIQIKLFLHLTCSLRSR